MDASELSVLTALVGLVEIGTEARIVRVAIDLGCHFQDHEARRVLAAAASGAIVGRTDGAGEAEVNLGPNQPTVAAIDISRRRECQGTGRKVVVREPTTRGLRERHGERLAVALVQARGMGHECFEVKRREVLVGKR
jgi:hypothetical protein